MDIRIRKVTELAVGKRAVYSCDMTSFRFSALKQKPKSNRGQREQMEYLNEQLITQRKYLELAGKLKWPSRIAFGRNSGESFLNQ